MCASAKAAKRAAELENMLRGDPGGRWQMLTLTIRHHAGEPLSDVLGRLTQAWRRVRSTRAVREVFERRVTGSARAIEVTFGEHGWHPHVHLLLRTSEWSEAETETLVRAWTQSVDASPSAQRWSEPVRAGNQARYLAKMGAELAGIGKTAHGSTPWQLAELALEDDGAAALWREYQATMHGRRTLELDERAKALAKAGALPAEECDVVRIDIFREEFVELVKLEAVEPAIMWFALETAVFGGAASVRAMVDDACDAAARAPPLAA